MLRHRRVSLSKVLAAALLVLVTGGLARAQATRPGPAGAKDMKRPSPNTPAPCPVQGCVLTLSPLDFGTWSQQKIKKGAEFFITGDRIVAVPPSNSLFVGYLHDTNGKDDQGEGYDFRNEYYRGGLHFDLSKLEGRNTVRSAILHLRIYRTHIRGIHSDPDYNTSAASCATRIQAGKSRWWSDGTLRDVGAPVVTVAAASTQDMQIDVTELVRYWTTHPDSNFGMVLTGDNEDLGAFTETICQTQFVHAGDGAPTLTVVYNY